MPHSKKETLAVAERRAQVVTLFLQGVPQYEIACRLGLGTDAAGQMTVSRDLKAIREQWKQSAVRSFDEAKGKILEEIALVKREAWGGWQRSKEGRTTVRDKQLLSKAGRKRRRGKTDEAGEEQGEELEPVRFERERQVEQRDGDPRFLVLILDCIQEEEELLGLAARPGELSTCPPVVSFRIYEHPGFTNGTTVEGVASPPQPPEQLPPGADPDDFEWVDDDGVATEEEGGAGE